MKAVSAFPHEIRELDNVWIPMRDGVRLAGRVWLPQDAETNPVPAILEYIPYRKRDFTAARDARIHPYFAGHGYASVRVDIRGSGDSEGVLTDEYLPVEQQDGLDILKWIAEQPWCDGNVGMFGISWGGFNGLQIAALDPPELKAIVTVCSTDDRYADDVHHMGGCLLGDNLSWSGVMFAYNSLPPDPQIVGDRWRDMWLERLDGSGLWIGKWLEHQRRDAYWRHGSVCEDYDAIKVPTYAVGGWADGYSNAVFRLMENLSVPRKGLIGPWSHRYPHIGVPGPAIDFLGECLRWWDQWLKGEETGIMQEPRLRVWMQDSVPPTPSYEFRPGRWVAEADWPAERTSWQRFVLDQTRLASSDSAVTESSLTVRSPLTLGLFAGKWCSYSAGPDLSHDQREEDGGALVFDSDFLEQDCEILGAPWLELVLSSDQPIAMLAARLIDVAPDDKANRVTYGLLNLTHRNSNRQPEYLVPGEKFRVRLQLNHIAQVFPRNHRFRLSLSTSYWPLAWPPPKPTLLTVYTAVSALHLPIRPKSDTDDRLSEFDPPIAAPALEQRMIEPQHLNWFVHRNLAADTSTLEVIKDDGIFHHETTDLTITDRAWEWYKSRDDQFVSVSGEVLSERGLQRGDWKVLTRTRTVLRCTEDAFLVEADLDAYSSDRRIFSRNWNERIPRDFV